MELLVTPQQRDLAEEDQVIRRLYEEGKKSAEIADTRQHLLLPSLHGYFNSLLGTRQVQKWRNTAVSICSSIVASMMRAC